MSGKFIPALKDEAFFAFFGKEEFNKIIFDLIKLHLKERKKFKIFIKNKRNWIPEISDEFYEKYPEFVRVDINEYELKNSIINKDLFKLNILFGEHNFEKEINKRDIIGIFDIEGNPILLKNFDDEETNEKQKIEGSIERSLNIFKKNNMYLATH